METPIWSVLKQRNPRDNGNGERRRATRCRLVWRETSIVTSTPGPWLEDQPEMVQCWSPTMSGKGKMSRWAAVIPISTDHHLGMNLQLEKTGEQEPLTA